ncbi:MAG: hypothetical protein ACTHNM_02265 [Dyella sp.]|uniref:hypothetical protein n=1 Tax=Dyella sp. TaxID=1869338 RepID=UPI003F7D3F26
MAVNLYGASLFGNAYKSAVIRGKNNAPGGEGGVDVDVQYRLGAPGSASMLDRKHGICCGITVAWIIGFCHGNDEAKNTTNFPDYFANTLRFQGAYLKDHKGNVSSIDDLDGIHPHGLVRAGNGKCAVNALSGLYPDGTWAAYLGVWHHAIGIGRTGGGFGHSARYCIMDPNAGLFKYKNKSEFTADVRALCEARRASKGESAGAKISYTFFKKA